MKNENKKAMWEIFKDGFIPRVPWRMRTPIGLIAYRTKREAEEARDTYIKSAESNTPASPAPMAEEPAHEKCDICGSDVIFESGPNTPSEYEICEICARHVCEDCADFSAPHNGNKCKDCTGKSPAPTAHTPGPWKHDKGYIFGCDGSLIVDGLQTESEAEREANSALIAAAPELLSALRVLVNARKRGDIDVTEWDIVDSAIAKAEGR